MYLGEVFGAGRVKVGPRRALAALDAGRDPCESDHCALEEVLARPKAGLATARACGAKALLD